MKSDFLPHYRPSDNVEMLVKPRQVKYCHIYSQLTTVLCSSKPLYQGYNSKLHSGKRDYVALN